jgi:hypothetical protein
MPAISLEGIGKKYRVASSKSLRLREVLSFGKKRPRTSGLCRT